MTNETVAFGAPGIEPRWTSSAGMLPEQVWDADDLPGGNLKRGDPTGAAMPLCWAHAEYVSLVRSHQDGVCFDRIEPVYHRYAKGDRTSAIEMWTFEHPTGRIAAGKTLRLITPRSATIHWTSDGWLTAHDLEMRDTAGGCWFGDLATTRLAAGACVDFTFLWGERWEGKNLRVTVETPGVARDETRFP